MTRRDFFTTCSKDMLKNAFSTWHNLQTEMEKEATKTSCDEAALKLGRKARVLHRKAAFSIGRNKKVTLNSKGGKK